MKTAQNKKKVIIIVLIAAAAVLITAAAGGWAMFGTQLTAANSIEKLDEHLWSMEYKGDYGFNDFLAQGGAASDEEMAVYITSFLSHGFSKMEMSVAAGNFGCSTLSVKSPENDALFGRNYDWEQCDAMVIHTVPDDGYESVSTCCLDFLGFEEGWVPDGGIGDRLMALAAVYVPLDGMNEKGLCVADLIVNNGEVTHQNTDKPDLTITSAIRLLLDKAATVDEALALLAQYDINFSIDSAHHLSIADAAGRSAAVEYINGEMTVTETEVVTNHYLSEGAESAPGRQQSYSRYDTLSALCLKSGGVMTADEVRSALAAAAQSNFADTNGGELTRWSLVYEQEELTASFYDTENWEQPYTIELNASPWLKKQ